MKITFERETIAEIVADIYAFVANATSMGEALPSREAKPKADTSVRLIPAEEVAAEKKAAQERLAEKPKNKGGRPKGYSPKKNGAAVNAHKNAADKAKARAKIEVKAPEPKSADEYEMAHPEEVSFEDLELPAPEPAPEPEEVLTATQLAAIRVKTTKVLQEAYAGGKHTQVLALLSKYGNGAKSFRELHIEDFVPIQKAIEGGALA